MRRILWLLFGAVVLISLAYWYQGQQLNTVPPTTVSGLRLTNRPATFCPASAQVVVVQTADPETLLYDDNATVENCEQVAIDKKLIAAAAEYQIYIRVAGSRAVRIVAAGPITTLVDVPIQLGDINDDNVINEVDQRFIESQIGQTSIEALAADVDGDSQVTVLDYSLVATNQGAGQVRPDQKAWGAQQ